MEMDHEDSDDSQSLALEYEEQDSSNGYDSADLSDDQSGLDIEDAISIAAASSDEDTEINTADSNRSREQLKAHSPGDLPSFVSKRSSARYSTPSEPSRAMLVHRLIFAKGHSVDKPLA